MMRVAVHLVAALVAGQALAGEGTGSFSGLGGHAAVGSVAVVEGDGGWEVRLGDDFSFDGAPDPWLSFGAGGRVAEKAIIYRLRANAGAQHYAVPDDVDPTGYDEVYIWCRRYAVPMGVAKIAP